MSARTNLVYRLLGGVMLASIALAACTTATPEVVVQTEEVEVTREVEVEPTAGPEEPVTLVVWADGAAIGNMETDPDGKGKYANYLKDLFEAEHPGVTVLLEDHGWDESLRQNLTNALLAGTAPDVIVGEGFFRSYAGLGAMLPIDISGMEDNLIPGTYQGALYQDQIYGLSGYTGVFGFERNCDVVSAAGLDCDNPPTTWDQVLEQGAIINDAGAGEFFGYTLQGPGEFALGSAFRINALLLQVDAPMGIPGSSGLDVPNFNDPDAIPVWEMIREVNAFTPPGLTFEPDEGVVYSQLHQGKSAYQIAGSWHVNWAIENGCTDCRYSEVPLLDGGQPASLVVANVIYGALKSSKNPALAIEFVQFTQRDDVQALVFQATGRMPSTRSALTALRPSVDAATQAYIDVLLNSQNMAAMPQWEKNPQLIWQAFTDFEIKLFTTDATVAELLDELQATAMAALE